jgi:uncharacterized repeat protein (TIGR01451 family)
MKAGLIDMKQCSVKLILWLMLMLGGVFFSPLVLAVMSYQGSSYGWQASIPKTGTLTAMTVNKPVGSAANDMLVATFMVRPQGTTITSPSGWQLFRRTTQTQGGLNTPPCGLEIISYYRILPVGDTDTSYTWYISYPLTGSGWSPTSACNTTISSASNGFALGSILRFSGSFPPSPIYYSGEDASATLNGNSNTHSAESIDVDIPTTMIISGIGYLSSHTFGTPLRTGGVQSTAPTIATQVRVSGANGPSPNGAQVDSVAGLSLQMSYFPQSAVGATGRVTATATGSDIDYGVGHMIAISETSSGVDLAIAKTAVITGNNAAYTINVKNNGYNTEPGPITVVDTLPAGLTYSSSSGTNWHCSAALQVVTCVYGTGSSPYTGIALALNASTTALTINATSSAAGVYTNTATVTGQYGDTNYIDNTVNRTDSIGGAVIYSGKVYNDANRNSSFDTGETGIGQSLYIKVTSRTGSTCNSPATKAIPTDPGTGAYGFGIANGNYCLILDTNNLLTDITSTLPASYITTETASGVINSFTAAGVSQSNLNFGLYQPANVKIIKTLSPTTDSGKFNLTVSGGTPTGGANPATNVGNTGTTDYVIVSRDSTITVQETAGTGTSLSDYTTLLNCTEGDSSTPYSLTSSILTGTTRTGTFTSPASDKTGTRSQVICTFTNTKIPTLTLQKNISSRFNSTDQFQLSINNGTTTNTATTTGATTGLQSQSTSFTGAASYTVNETMASGSISTLSQYTPVLVCANAISGGTSVASVTLGTAFSLLATDQVTCTITNTSKPTVKLQKQVFNGTSWVISNAAKPGDVIEYRITYTNNGSTSINTLVISDTTPLHTTFVSAAAGIFPPNLTACQKTTPTSATAISCASTDTAGGTGVIQWSFTGSLTPGASGNVTFQVKLD